MDTIIDSAAWLAELEAVGRAIMEGEPVAALEQLEALRSELRGDTSDAD